MSAELTMRSINLNDSVLFRVSDFGALIIGRYMQEHGEDPIDTRFPDGTARMQLWRFMVIFGSHLSMTAEPPIKHNTLEFVP